MFAQLTTNRRQKISQRDPWLRVAQTALMLLLLMIAISPITQSIWKSDNFLHGQDTETTLVLALTLASIAVWRMQRSRIDIDATLNAVRNFLSLLLGGRLLLYLAGLGHGVSDPVAIHNRRGPRVDTAAISCHF